MIRRLSACGLVATLATIAPAPLQAAEVGTAFTYQGKLDIGGQPADGVYDVRFRLMTAAGGGGIGDQPVGDPLAFNDITLTDGLFTASLDFGPGAMNGDARWLEISVRPGSGIIYTVLAPRQKLTPAPYAIGLALPYAGSASSGSTLINVHQQGAGGAASFTVEDESGGNVLYLQSSSDAAALYSFATGAGKAGEFVNYNASSTVSALAAQTIGFGAAVFGTSSKGKGGWFKIDNSDNSSDALHAETNGTGDAILATNSAWAGGRAGWFRVTHGANPTEAFRADTYGRGSAGYFRILNDTSNAAALRTETNGSGAGLYAANTGGGPALQIGPGAIKIDGAGVNTPTCAFIHATTEANVFNSATTINHPHINDNPNVILIVTTNARSTSPVDPYPVGVAYSTVTDTWKIYHLGGQTMPAGVAFNVLVLKP